MFNCYIVKYFDQPQAIFPTEAAAQDFAFDCAARWGLANVPDDVGAYIPGLPF